MIQGRIKYYDIDGGYKLYTEALENGILLTTEAYNSLLSVADCVKQNDEDRWKLITVCDF